MTRDPLVDTLPLSLYVHFPWCAQKCPYCDFNSHAVKGAIPEKQYIDCLIRDLQFDLARCDKRPIQSIFFGGGTPSLLSGDGMKLFFEQLLENIELMPSAEVTLEANPGAVDSDNFVQCRQAGINRLSIGVQSFRDRQLQLLGRIHSGQEAVKAYHAAREAGFDNINLDLMFGLPEDTREGCLDDLAMAISLEPEHLSWYQLTLEPNTLFYQRPPKLPEEDHICEYQASGQAMMGESGYEQYEISAYSKVGLHSQHNLNYWRFGDYLGIGAGAHSKLTRVFESGLGVERFSKVRHPRDYMQKAGEKKATSGIRSLRGTDLILEFMMNCLRLNSGFEKRLFERRTGLSLSQIKPQLMLAERQGLLDLPETDSSGIKPTKKGLRYLNNLLGIFVED